MTAPATRGYSRQMHQQALLPTSNHKLLTVHPWAQADLGPMLGLSSLRQGDRPEDRSRKRTANGL